MPNIGFPELVIILVVVALLFGATRLPKLARSVGQSAKEFRKGLEGVDDDDEDSESDKSKEKKRAKAGAKNQSAESEDDE